MRVTSDGSLDPVPFNHAFNEFLALSEQDTRLLENQRELLLVAAEQFSAVFSDFLRYCPAAVRTLQIYQDHGESIQNVIDSHVLHLMSVLSGSVDVSSAAELLAKGQFYQELGMEPMWIFGTYRLYFSHLQHFISTATAIIDTERDALNQAVIKLLARDLGLVLQGYWKTVTNQLEFENLKLQALQDQLSSVLSNIPQILWSVDVLANKFLFVSPTTKRISTADLTLPIPCFNWTVIEDRPALERAWARALKGETVDVESRVTGIDGAVRWFRRIFQPVINISGQIVRIDGVMEDISDFKQAMERLQLLATVDGLTGLANRTSWYDRLNQALALAQRESDKQVAVMMLDLNHFKIINDTLGHSAGDELLCQVAKRLQTALRKSDTLGRFGGDEFAILLSGLNNGRQSAEKVANNISDLFAEPFWLAEHEIYSGISIGISIFPEHGLSADFLLRRADLAMYEAKGKGVSYAFFNAESEKNYVRRLEVSVELRHALERDEFTLHYQPQVNIKTGQVVRLEALLRWQHQRSGLLIPDQFLSMAEQTGIINHITEWVINQACKEQVQLCQQGFDLPISINLSTRSVHDPRLLGRVAAALQQLGAASKLGLEVTENSLMSDIEHGQKILRQFCDMGVQLVIDNFGTGYSSLKGLKSLTGCMLKIDRSFVSSMLRNESDAQVVKSSIDLGHDLGFKVIGEGVSDHTTWDRLESMGCDFAQGYLFSYPIAFQDLPRFLTDRQSSPPLFFI